MSKESQCTITTHEITDDGMGCQCGYLVKTYEDDYEHPIRAIRRDIGYEVNVRKMNKDEMPDDGITYYADTDCTIYQERELSIVDPNTKRKDREDEQ